MSMSYMCILTLSCREGQCQLPMGPQYLAESQRDESLEGLTRLPPTPWALLAAWLWSQDTGITALSLCRGWGSRKHAFTFPAVLCMF